MSTVIYPSPIFGPVHSRRLGLSLGINLMPGDGKICTFDCVYCECGLNGSHRPHLPRPSRSEEHPDVLTFAGNGEPTAHPDFPAIIDDTLRLRDRYCPEAKVSVLSNATRIGREDVRRALMRVDNNIQKLDTVDIDYIKLVDQPVGAYDLEDVIENMRLFEGHVIIQTMFMRGTFEKDGRSVSADNTSEKFVGPWLEAVKAIKPQQVMIYTIDRETPVNGLQKASREQLDAIRDRVISAGIPCSASY